MPSIVSFAIDIARLITSSIVAGSELGVSITSFSGLGSAWTTAFAGVDFCDFLAVFLIEIVGPVERIEVLESHIIVDWFICINKGVLIYEST